MAITPFPVTSSAAIPIGRGINEDQEPVAINLGAMVFTAAGQGFSVDLSQQVQEGRIHNVVALYVDNSQNTNAVTIFIPVINQSLNVPASVQEYVPVLMPFEILFTVTSAGAGTTNIIVTNSKLLGFSKL